MSTLTEATTSPAGDRSTPPTAAYAAQGQVRRRVSLLVTLVVLVWSTIQLVNLADRHTTGPQIYGILVAVAAVAAGVLSLLLVWTARRGVRTTAAVLLLWAVVAFGGIAGTVAHVLVRARPKSTFPGDPLRLQ